MKDQFKKEIIKQFMENRDRLIDQLETKEIGKNQFIEQNDIFFEKLLIEPSTDPLESFEEGMFNYQYYNTKAKGAKKLAFELKYKDPFKAKDLRDETNRFYKLKEIETRKLMKFVEYKGIRAYYIKSDSQSLNGELYEIVFDDYYRVILHSMDKSIKKLLMDKKIFDKRIRKSIIDAYINSLY